MDEELDFHLEMRTREYAERGLERSGAREAARASLGAGRARIARQLLTESLVLAALGGAAGLVVATGGPRLLVGSAPPLVAAEDGRGRPRVMIVSETARLAWPGEDPIGKRMSCCEGSEDDPRCPPRP